MDKLLFSVYDSKAGFFGFPITFRSVGEAKRSFADIANDDKSQIGLHPEDFSLVLLGVFNEITGKFENYDHENLGTAASYKVGIPVSKNLNLVQ